MKTNRHLLSLAILGIFFLLATASKVNKMAGKSFSDNLQPEGTGENYVELKDGTIIKRKTLDAQGGVFSKGYFIVDGQKYPMNEVKGYTYRQAYYLVKGGYRYKRVVHGRINVYEKSVAVTDRDASGYMTSSVQTKYYYQHGDNGELKGMANQREIKQAVADCPLSVQMASKSNGQMRKAIRRNRSYLNEIFETYNNNCQPLE